MFYVTKNSGNAFYAFQVPLIQNVTFLTLSLGQLTEGQIGNDSYSDLTKFPGFKTLAI